MKTNHGGCIGLTGNLGTRGRGGGLAGLQAQRDSTVGVGAPLQGGGLARGELVATLGVVEGILSAGGRGNGGQGSGGEEGEGAHCGYLRCKGWRDERSD